MAVLDVGPTVEEPNLAPWRLGEYEHDGRTHYDEYTGFALDTQLVINARHEEIEFMAKLGCWKVVLRASMTPGCKGHRHEMDRPQ